ncbi:MAG TPA: glycosyl transferase, partial [Allocoleopsis sp.]
MGMKQPILYAAVTNHGFGHATRTASVLAEVKRLCPEVVIALVTTAPRWLLDSYLQADFIHRPIALDIGIIQSDSITMDKESTLEKLRRIREQEKQIVAREVTFIQQNRVSLVLGDIPPIASAIARAANIPCWMMSNFGWDFIYRPWGGEFVAEAAWIEAQFSQCDRLFRLPFHESMRAFPNIVDVGLTGGSPHFGLDELRQQFNLMVPIERTILLTFGGLGLSAIPYTNLNRFPDWQFISFDRQAPDLPNLIKVSDPQYRPVDFMPLCSRVVSKPGYSTFAEACRMEVPLATITRDDFAEAAVLIDSVQDVHPHQILQPNDFFQGNWDFLRQDPQPPKTDRRLDKNGNTTIAQAILDYLFS